MSKRHEQFIIVLSRQKKYRTIEAHSFDSFTRDVAEVDSSSEMPQCHCCEHMSSWASKVSKSGAGKPGDWYCGTCGNLNYMWREECNKPDCKQRYDDRVCPLVPHPYDARMYKEEAKQAGRVKLNCRSDYEENIRQLADANVEAFAQFEACSMTLTSEIRALEATVLQLYEDNVAMRVELKEKSVVKPAHVCSKCVCSQVECERLDAVTKLKDKIATLEQEKKVMKISMNALKTALWNALKIEEDKF